MKTFYKRNLPHYTPEGHIFFITSRLTDSLPNNVIEQLKREKQKDDKFIAGIKDIRIRKEKYYENQKLYFSKFDNALDNLSNGPYWLKNESIAEIVKDAFHYRDRNVYNLYTFTIMPNHIHILIKPIVGQLGKLSEPKAKAKNKERGQLTKLSYKQNIGRTKPSPYFLGDIMESLKRYTALECNRILKRKGSFWQHENYDHVVRNQKELVRIVEYILNNPVKAGFCNSPKEWQWNYYNPNLISL